MSATNRGAKRKKNDFYPTPANAIVPFLRKWQPHNGASWLEPGAGDGAIIKTVSNYLCEPDINFTAVDIQTAVFYQQPIVELPNIQWHLGVDFLKWQPPCKYDYIIGNPPYLLALEFAIKCLEYADEIAFLLRVGFLGSQERYLFNKAYPADINVLPTRPGFTGNGKTDASEYAWFHWSPESLSNGGRIFILDP